MKSYLYALYRMVTSGGLGWPLTLKPPRFLHFALPLISS